MWVKKSVGIILISEDCTKILLVQKRFTNAFSMFVRNKYEDIAVETLFREMTLHEKLLLKSMNFDAIWYHLNLNDNKTDYYYQCLLKFNAFISDGGTRLSKIINNTPNSNNLKWEPPKGRKELNESNCECAIRELKEETGIDSDQYKFSVYMKNNKYITSNISNKIKYIVIYYTAKANVMNDPIFDNNNLNQTVEIMDTKWINIDNLNNYNIDIPLKDYIINTAIRQKKLKKHLISMF